MLPFLGVGAVLLLMAWSGALGVHLGTWLYCTGGPATVWVKRIRNGLLVLGLVLFAAVALLGVLDQLS